MAIIIENRKFQVSIDYDQSVEQMVLAGGYQKVHKDVTSSNFPSKEKGKGAIEILILKSDNKSLTTEEILDEMASLDLQPITIRELLALGAKFVDLERSVGPIAAFGSSINRNAPCIPCIFRTKLGRHIDLMMNLKGDCWDKDLWRFAAVRR
ncbi:MAG: hypothetical protein FJZ86_18400 [Chloroflexi bacterium]|nr:hypothetical protein [Chloroflexota bacterium]